MIPSVRQLTQSTLQSLLLKRFSMGMATYFLMALLCYAGAAIGLSRVSLSTLVTVSALVLFSQLAFLYLFLSKTNLRFQDPSLTEAQLLVALSWLTVTLAMFEQGRGAFLVMYVLVLLFGIFQLQPAVFFRCALFAFVGFASLNLHEAWNDRLPDPGLAALEVAMLLAALVWLSLFASYVQAMRQRMRQRRFALQAHQDTLRGMMRQLEDLAATDELTGLFNRRHFLRLAARAQAELDGRRLHGLALVDLDHFKRINDAHGHAAGDRVLQAFASVARASLREGDVIARYGGEEFVVLVPDTQPADFALCCERLREAYSRAEPAGVKLNDLSLSIGMTLLSQHDNLDEALNRADRALYQAKRGGRARCCASWEAADA